MFPKLCVLLVLAIGCSPLATAQVKRNLNLDDVLALRDVSDPRISPDGEWVAYSVRTNDLVQDKRISQIWMSRWDGGRAIQLTHGKISVSKPRWSPDGRYLAFVSSREHEKEYAQVWLLDRSGGEAQRITDFKAGVDDYAWSPDSKRLALIVGDAEPEEEEPSRQGGTAGATKPKDDKEKRPKPIVIDRFQFKEDEVGYLTRKRQHLYLFEIESRKWDLLTPGDHDESLPSWSPDGKSIAFVSKRGADPDRHDNYDIYVIDAAPGAKARQLTTFQGGDSDPSWSSPPAWSPDGKYIAYLQGGPPDLIWYAVHRLAVIPASGGAPRVLTPALDRNVSRPQWDPAGKNIYFLVEDDRTDYLARVAFTPAGDAPRLEPVLQQRSSISSADIGRDGRIAALISNPQLPNEVFVLDKGAPRQLTQTNQSLLAALNLAPTEEISFKSKDGTQVNGFLVRPPGFQAGKRYPTLLRIHGGPVAQFANEFSKEAQVFAALGYVVVMANPRGSSGRGQEFSRAIFAAWGHKDAEDVLAAVDYAVAQGIADQNRLGIGGWSYGGMLTNYTIATDKRFKAATSGSSIANNFAGYGTDRYVREYEAELGRPWEKPENWSRVSFPFYHADRISTPTLFLCGDKDFNVPLLNSEQMYQALRSLGLPTQLIIYPGEYHEIRRPSFVRDRLQRYIDWYARYLKPGA